MGAAVGCGSALQVECLEGFDFLGLHHIKINTYLHNRYIMRLIEILAEASERQKRRNAKQSAQSKRAADNAAPDALTRQKGVPRNVPPKSHYITNKPLMKQADVPGAFAGPEFDAFREPEADPTESKGVVLRFQSRKSKTSGRPTVYAYWAHDYAPDFSDCDALGTTREVYEVYSYATFDLVDELVGKEHNVSILIDQLINQQFPADVKKLEKWSTSKANTKKYNGSLNFEIDDSATQSKPIAAPVTVPTADVRIPNADALSAQIIAKIRSNPQLMAKYTAADKEVREKALKAGVVTLHKFKDIDDAVDDVDAML